MLNQANVSVSSAAAFSLNVGVSRDVCVREAEQPATFDGLYPVDQMPVEEEAMIFWGDVSILARHPSRIAL
ncbi:MAG: hypothetical protein H7A05_06775 [Pseudomonadales bacterium]|nr:hypothetical protein [Pseudomonadales bacterium]MCP5344305.1 hypothetical protein [Pseudomonadales bacterium]